MIQLLKIGAICLSLAFIFCQKREYPDRNLLKEYAFCKCFHYANSNLDFFRKEDISLSVYREFAAGAPIELFNGIDSLAKVAAGNIKPSIIPDHGGKKAIIKWCFNFYNSKELNDLIQKFESDQNRND